MECITTIKSNKGEMTVNICKIIEKCENEDCRCKYSRRAEKENEEIALEA